MTTPRSSLIPRGHSKPIGRYSPGVRAELPAGASLVFVSGQVATDDAGVVLCPDDPGGQTRVVFARIADVLAEAGATLADIVSVTIYLTDVAAHFTAVSAVRNELLPEPPPASVLVEVSRLAEPGCLVEISAVAVAGDGS
ncbi:RidA family protein [Actinoplanes teichomyceticus]|uniref:Enamine deaminase RidA (YjgF/YER057c/UK114 family) n=1 Tax=Actinoplanes teichomyceticus TaxID=1867 RepID=A0A561VIN5_ACTTI|nr:RidA family protein [Actinoplanes teichomyceticus]TWG11473.1 enamine deaminase RidA (YjgF/YER057c/UK114 family) [Actinoplanes teichomyceticus]GIF15713.1 reactive intermediate/imine deaminase [Actinoplanes teichomyceticus]